MLAKTIPSSHLVLGATYEGWSRNTTVAKWTGNYFEYKRKKFGYEYIDTIAHPEHDNTFDVFYPFKQLDAGTENERETGSTD